MSICLIQALLTSTKHENQLTGTEQFGIKKQSVISSQKNTHQQSAKRFPSAAPPKVSDG